MDREMHIESKVRAVVLVSAGAEWRGLRPRFAELHERPSPYGSWMEAGIPVNGRVEPVIFLHGGWGKIAAAGSTQYAIDRWRPEMLFNLGTCGGFRGCIDKGAILLVDHTLAYDILEQMSDAAGALAHYETRLNTDWAGPDLPAGVQRGKLVSGDRDLLVDEVPLLAERYGAAAGDWESAAIAYVASHNHVRLAILRGVTDLVGPGGGEAYGNYELFVENSRQIMNRLVDDLPFWLEKAFLEK